MNLKLGPKSETLSDVELLDKYRKQNDPHALYILIHQRYKKRILGVFGNVFKNYETYDLNERLDDFYYHLAELRKNKFDKFNPKKPFEGYLIGMAKNWALDYCREEIREKKRFQHLPEKNESDDDESNDIVSDEPMSELEKNTSLVLTLENLHKFSPRDRYIALTFLLCECYKSNTTPLKLAEHLSKQLGITVGAVKMANYHVMEKLKAEAKKYLDKDVTFS